MTARICIVTSGHLSTCPRMLKAADALHGAGYRVRVVSVNHTPWATEGDRAVMARRHWEWTPIDYARASAPLTRLTTGARFHAARKAALVLGSSRLPLAVARRAVSRAHDEIVRAVTARPADFVYGGTTGALAAIAASAERLRVPYALDLEDFHSEEQDPPLTALVGTMVERIERDVLPGARFLTAGSPMIADAYAEKYGVRPVAIHNTFSIASPTAATPEVGPLRVYWFSQTLGPGRGLEDVIRALGRISEPAELHLRARPIPGYLESLRLLQQQEAPRTVLTLHAPAAPDEMVPLAQPYDIGLSAEAPTVRNRQLCLGNKIFTYLAAGLPVILSRTPAQAAFERGLGSAAVGYDCGDVDRLASHLRRLGSDLAARREARRAARDAAERRWHWEHPEDRGALLDAVRAAAG
jgi:glycosyltransferase involved in cell wall biosynthesis